MGARGHLVGVGVLLFVLFVGGIIILVLFDCFVGIFWVFGLCLIYIIMAILTSGNMAI